MTLKEAITFGFSVIVLWLYSTLDTLMCFTSEFVCQKKPIEDELSDLNENFTAGCENILHTFYKQLVSGKTLKLE